MVDVIAAVDSTTGAFGPLVQNRLHADMQSAINAGVTTAMSATPAFVDAIANIVTDSLVAGLVTTNSTTRGSLDTRYLYATPGVTLQSAVLRMSRRYGETWYNVMDFGATGDGVADDTNAVQATVNAALNDSTPADVENPQYTGGAPVVYFPKGTYSVGQINIPGAVVIRGCGGGIYAASELRQRTDGYSILSFTADTDGSSNCFVVENMTFKSGSASSNQNVAQIKCEAPQGNSCYIRNCWFKTPENVGVWHVRGNDIVIEGCTFDVCPFSAIKFGSDAAGVVDSRIVNNTFYGVSQRCVWLYNAARILIANNNVVGQTAPVLSGSVFVEGHSASDVTVSVNTIYGSSRFLLLDSASGCISWAATGNVGKAIETSLVEVTGTALMFMLVITGNKFESTAAYQSGSAFTAPSAKVQSSVFANNAVIAGATTPRLFNMPDGNTTNNVMGPNASLRFSAKSNFQDPAGNGVASN